MTNNVTGYTLLKPLAYSEIKANTIVVEIRIIKAGSKFIRGRNTANSEYYFLALPNVTSDRGVIGGFLLMDTPKIHWTEVESNPEIFAAFQIISE